MTAGVRRIQVIEGTALPLDGDDVDTDRIIPARYLRTVSFEGLDRHVFEDDRAAARAAGSGSHPFDDPRHAGAGVLLVRRNFGCGSSREHAPQALYRWGIRVVVGESFSDIFFGNAAAIGLPCVTASRADLEDFVALVAAQPGLAVRVDLDRLTCEAGGVAFRIAMPRNAREAFLTGAWDSTGQLLERFEEVRAVAARLPYIAGFAAAERATPA